MKRLLVCMDVSNLYYCISKKFEGRRLNYAEYIKYLNGLGEIQKMIAYGAQVGKEANAFIHCLRKLGFETKYKTPRVFRNGLQTKRKADWDVGIAMDIVNMVELKSVDMIILGSADGDLTPCVEWAKARGVDVVVLACGIARELKKTATLFVEIPESFLERLDHEKNADDHRPKDKSIDTSASKETSRGIREDIHKSGDA